MSRIQRYGAEGRAVRATPALPEVIVRKGAPKVDPKRPGEDLTYFRFDWPEGFEDAQRIFVELYGDKPTRLDTVLVLSDRVDDVFSSAMESWRSGAKKSVLIRRCNGVEIEFLREGDTVHRNAGIACDPACDCAPVGRFSFILPDFVRASGELMTFRLITRGKTDIDQIGATLDFASESSGGRLRSIVFSLYREMRELRTPNGATVSKSVVCLSIGNASLHAIAREFAAITAGAAINGPVGAPPALPASVTAAQTSSKRSTSSQRSKSKTWASARLIDELYASFCDKCAVISAADFHALAGVDSTKALVEQYDALYASRGEAIAAIQDAYDAQNGGE